MPSLESGWPAHSSSSSVGSLQRAPADERGDRDDGAGTVAQRLAQARQGEDRPDRDDGIRRPDDHARAPRRSPRAPAASARPPRRRGTRRPRRARPRARGSATPAGRSTPRRDLIRVRTGSSLIGSTRAGTPNARRRSSAAAVAVAPAASRRARARHTARSWSPRLNHTSSPSARSASITRERVVAQPPAALVDAVGEPERDEVGVGRDVTAVDLDVVARVGDHDEVLADDVEHPAGELGPAGPAGEHDDRSGHRRGP